MQRMGHFLRVSGLRIRENYIVWGMLQGLFAGPAALECGNVIYIFRGRRRAGGGKPDFSVYRVGNGDGDPV